MALRAVQGTNACLPTMPLAQRKTELTCCAAATSDDSRPASRRSRRRLARAEGVRGLHARRPGHYAPYAAQWTVLVQRQSHALVQEPSKRGRAASRHPGTQSATPRHAIGRYVRDNPTGASGPRAEGPAPHDDNRLVPNRRARMNRDASQDATMMHRGTALQRLGPSRRVPQR